MICTSLLSGDFTLDKSSLISKARLPRQSVGQDMYHGRRKRATERSASSSYMIYSSTQDQKFFLHKFNVVRFFRLEKVFFVSRNI